jgi:hypothetical protein
LSGTEVPIGNLTGALDAVAKAAVAS